ncbi:MAG: hypothetical protein QXR80_07245 [Desulfurococcaceae archaeon]
MEYLEYVYLTLAGLAVLILLFIAVKISGLVRNINRQLDLLTPLLTNLKSSSEKLNDNLELTQRTLENLNNLLQELKIVPKVVEELGRSIKDFEAFFKGQIEVLKDDIHFTLEDTRTILKDVKEVSSELKGKTLKLTQNLDPLLNSITEASETARIFLDNLNNTMKKTFIEVGAITAGVSEIIRGVRRILGFKSKELITKE